MCDLQDNWVAPPHKVVPQTRKQMYKEGKCEEQQDPKARKGRGTMRDQTIQSQPMSDHNRNSSSNNKGCFNCENWRQRRARSLSRRSDRLDHNRKRCQRNVHGVNQMKHASLCENWQFRNDRGQDSVKHNEHSSDDKKCDKRRAHNSSYGTDRQVRYNRPHSDAHRANQFKHIAEWENCPRNYPSRSSFRYNERSADTDNWRIRTTRVSSPQGDRPVHNQNTSHSNGHRLDRFIRVWENCGAGNDHCQDSVKPNKRSSDIARPVSYKNWHHSNLYGVNLCKHASHDKNWRFRNDCKKDGFKDSKHSSGSEIVLQRSPHNASRYNIWAIFNGKLSQGSQFKPDCGNWRSGNDHHRDGVDRHKTCLKDTNWRSRRDCERDQVEHCDQAPDHDKVAEQHEFKEQRVADGNEERKVTEVQNMCNAGRKLLLKHDWLSRHKHEISSNFFVQFLVQVRQ